MFASSRRRRHSPIDIWPGFVDALATLLMVIIFVLMTFVVAQLYLTNAISDKDEALANLNQKLEALTLVLGDEKKLNEQHQSKNAELSTLLDALQKQISTLKQEVDDHQAEKILTVQKNTTLSQQIEDLTQQLAKLTLALSSSETKNKEMETEVSSLKLQLESTLTGKNDELKKLNDELETVKDKHKETNRLGQLRSEFFTKLQQAVGNRSDMRVVGDRFVFQSEVLFDKGSAELGVDGKEKLDQLAGALKEISDKISGNLNWILRVDGHTDRLPIHNKFASNWELSSARAISVVKYLIEKGIDSKHLVAAGFGEHQPMDEGEKEEELAKNRRIEFKLDQR
jgi:chemotaxis protein MotB